MRNAPVTDDAVRGVRVGQMTEARLAGATLQEIGDQHGISRERVRQLLNANDGPSRDEIRAHQQRVADAAHHELSGRLSALLGELGPMTVDEAAEWAEVSPEAVARAWPRELGHLRLRPNTWASEVWSDDAILDAVRHSALYEYPITAAAYANLVKVGEVRGPSLPRVTQRFGSWSNACDRAGVVHGQTRRPAYDSRWTDNELLMYVRDYFLDPHRSTSARGYDEWRHSMCPDAPSGMTLRNRLGTWERIKLAVAIVDGAHID